MRSRAIAIGLLLAVSAVSAAAAQEVKIESRTAPPVDREIVTPGLHYEQSRPSDREYYPEGPRVEHDPAFIDDLSAQYQTPDGSGRAGVSGWTSPATPVGPTASIGQRDIPGWFGFGFSVTWGGPPSGPRRAVR
jgi:hypothetical protein